MRQRHVRGWPSHDVLSLVFFSSHLMHCSLLQSVPTVWEWNAQIVFFVLRHYHAAARQLVTSFLPRESLDPRLTWTKWKDMERRLGLQPLMLR